MRTYGTPRKHRDYGLEEYNPKWKDMFLQYVEQVKPILGENLIGAEHMGSTSIPGMVAKPQIDVLLIVENLDKIPKLYDEFRVKGFVPRGREYVGIGDEYVTLDDESGKRLASIHIFQKDHPQIKETLMFRDYLRINEQERKLYIKTKRDLYRKHKDNYEEYGTGKKECIDGIKRRMYQKLE